MVLQNDEQSECPRKGPIRADVRSDLIRAIDITIKRNGIDFDLNDIVFMNIVLANDSRDDQNK